jgi:hypothetical protein
VYVRLEQDTVSPAATVKPLVMLISLADAATAQWITTVPPEVSSVAVATGEALPVAFVSLVIALAVAVPPLDAANAVALKPRFATDVPGALTVPVKRKRRRPDAPMSAVTASVAALRAAVLCVTAIFQLLQFGLVNEADEFNRFNLAGFLALDFKRHAQFAHLSLQISHQITP